MLRVSQALEDLFFYAFVCACVFRYMSLEDKPGMNLNTECFAKCLHHLTLLAIQDTLKCVFNFLTGTQHLRAGQAMCRFTAWILGS